MSWDDLRIVLAIGRAGSLAGAARALGISHPTVFRRIREIEARLGMRLFERRAGRHVPLQAGEEAMRAAEAIATEIAALSRTLAGHNKRPSGVVRLATTDTLLFGPLPPMLAAFRSTYPEIVLEAAVSNAMADLSRREADVAVRPALDPPPSLVGRRICAIAFAAYGASDTRASEGGERWIAPDDSLSSLKLTQWMAARGLVADAAFRSNSLVGLREAARCGFGRAILPCYLGDPDPGLRRLTGPIAELATELWVLTHADLRTVARFKAFVTEMSRLFADRRSLFEGRDADDPDEPLDL